MKKSMLRPFGWLIWLAMFFVVSDQTAMFGRRLSTSGVDFARLNGLALLPVMLAEMTILTLGMPEVLRRGLTKCASCAEATRITIVAMMLTALVTAAMTLLIRNGKLDGTELVTLPGMGHLTGVEFNDWLAAFGFCASGVLVGIRCMQEYYCATERTTGAVILDVLAAAAIYGISLIRNAGMDELVYALLGILLVSVVVELIACKKHIFAGEKSRLEWNAMIKEVPSAFLRSGLYFAAMIVVLLMNFFQGVTDTAVLLMSMGMLVVEMGRSTFRRSDSESVIYTLTVTNLSALLAVVLLVVQVLSNSEMLHIRGVYIFTMRGVFLYAAAGTMLLLYAPLNWRVLIAGVLLLAAGCFPNRIVIGRNEIAIGVVSLLLTVTSALMTIPEWRKLLGRRVANKIRDGVE